MRQLALAFALTFAAAPLWAETAPAQPAEVDLLPGWREADGRHMAALRVRLAPGWHTYWRAPGEAGIPPEFDWSGSENLAEVGYRWPVPEIFDSNGITTLGYEQELILPIEITAEDPEAPVVLAAHLMLGVCQEICMPMEAQVSAVLPETGAHDRQIDFALAQRPDTAAEAGLVAASCAVEEISDGLRVTARLELPELGPGEHAVIEPADRDIWVSEAMTERHGAVLTAEADLVPPEAQPFALDPQGLRLTVLSQGRAVEIEGCTSAE